MLPAVRPRMELGFSGGEKTVSTLHIVGSCRRAVGIEFDIRKLDTS